MPLAERYDVIESLKTLFEDCTAGKGQAVLVSGGLASGKTELLHEFSAYAVESGALLLTAAGSRAEGSLQMGVLDQLLRGAALPTGIDDRLSELVTVDALATDDTDTEAVALRGSDARAAHEVCSVLLELSRERPIVIGIDDVHLVDSASLQVLLYLQRRMRSSRILLILNELARPWLVRPMFHAEVTRQPHHRIKLGALSPSGVAELLAQRLDADAASGSAAAYHALSGGNPLLVHALIDDLGGTAATSEGLELPSRSAAFSQAVLSCLHRADPQLLTVARGLAMLDQSVEPSLVARLTGLDQDSVSQAIEELVAAGLVAAGRFRHPATAATVLDSLAPEQRSRMHVAAAELLHQRGAAPVDIARHLIAAEAVVGRWAVSILRNAASHALTNHDAEFAVQSLDLAMRTTTDERERLDIRNTLAKVEWRISPAAASRHLAPLRSALHQGDLPGREAGTVVRCLLWQGDIDAVVKTLNAVSDSGDPTATRIIAEFSLSYLWIYGAEPDVVVRFDDEPQDRWTRAVRAVTRLWTGGDSAEAVRAAEYVLQHRRDDTMLEVAASALLVLVYAGKLDRATSWCSALLDDAARSRAVTWQAVLNTIRSEIALRQGDLATAESLASQALGLLRPQSWGVLIGYPLYVLLHANTAMGRHDRAAELLKQVVPEAMFESMPGVRYLQACGHHYLATDRPLAALSEFQTCGRLVREWRIDLPSVMPWRCDLAQAQLRLDRRKMAKELVEEQQAIADPLADQRTRGTALRVLAAAGEPRQRPALLGEAVDCLHSYGDHLELSRALADLSQAYQELGDAGRARVTATRAEQEARNCHAEPRTTQSGSAGAEPCGGEGGDVDEAPVLSDAEQRVATLAALGHTNREIGRKLFITVSTVEQHLTRVYRKLNLSSRTDLPAGLSAHRMPVSVD